MGRKYLRYKIRIQYYGSGLEYTTPLPGWYRDIEISMTASLENLNEIIQNTLNWDAVHLYSYKIRNQEYAYLGPGDLIIDSNTDNKPLTCAIKFENLKLCKNDNLFYLYDFGAYHNFLLTILEIKEDNNTTALLLTGEGYDLNQYPACSDNIYLKNQISNLNLPQIITYEHTSRKHLWRIQFIPEDDKNILEKWRKSSNKRKWERAVTILENWNLSLEDISTKIERPVHILKRWISNYNKYGIKSLLKEQRDNKHIERTLLKTNRIIEILHNRPKHFGINRSNWNLENIVKVYKKEYKENISTTNVGLLMKKSGYKWKKARKVLTSSDADYKEKVNVLLQSLHSLKKDEAFFFIDELGPLRVKKYSGRTYTQIGKTKIIPQNPSYKGSISLCGALNAQTNQVIWFYCDSKDTIGMIDLCEILFNLYFTKAKIYITWDAASWHSSNQLISWLDNFNKKTEVLNEGPLIDFIPLPSCSQFLNVIESVFSGMKRAVIHNSNYNSENEIKEAISMHFIDRNDHFINNPKRAGNKIWEIDFFKDFNNIKSGDYRDW